MITKIRSNNVLLSRHFGSSFQHSFRRTSIGYHFLRYTKCVHQSSYPYVPALNIFGEIRYVHESLLFPIGVDDFNSIGMLYFMCVAPLVYKARTFLTAYIGSALLLLNCLDMALYFTGVGIRHIRNAELLINSMLFMHTDHIFPHSSFCRKSTPCSCTSSAHSLRLSSIIMSRFLLNIRQIQGSLGQASDEDCDDYSCPSTPSACLNTSIAMDSVVASPSLGSSIITVYV